MAYKAIVWSDEQVAALKKLRRVGYSAAEVAVKLTKQFGIPFTRCMVLGKEWRIKKESE